MKLRPVSSNGSHTIVGNEIRLAGGNQRVLLEIEMSGWSPECLKTYQAKIDADTGYTSGASGTLTPTTNFVCEGANATGNATCAANLGAGSRCIGSSTTGFCQAGWINRNHAQYVFRDTGTAQGDIDISSQNYRYFGISKACQDDMPTYIYGGSLSLFVPSNAQGTFTITFKEEGETFLARSPDNEFILPLTITAAQISIVCQTNANCTETPPNLCTTDTCNTQTGVCSFTPNYNIGTECCAPSTGNVTPISDGDQCTTDTCNPADGTVSHDIASAGTPCGSQANTQCDRPNSCDGVNTQANGGCLPRFEPDGTLCGDTTVTECNPADTCNGAGACQSNLHLRPNGFPCGSNSTGPCDQADSCNGAGTCLTNTSADNTACSTGQFCTENERCTAGVCGNGTPHVCDDLLTCTTDTCDEDNNECDYVQNANTCLIDDVCYQPGDLRPEIPPDPANTCEECNPSMSMTDWSVRANGSLCNDGNACTGTGRPGIDPDTCTDGTCAGEVDLECNADCEFAVPVVVGANISNNISGGPDDGEASCQSDSNNDVWFTYTADCTGATFLSTTGSALSPVNDTVLNVYTACPIPPPGGTGLEGEIECDDDSGVLLQSALTFQTTSDNGLCTGPGTPLPCCTGPAMGACGTKYWIRVAGFEQNKGPIVLNVRPVDDCLIAGVCYADGDLNPANDCQACIPELSTTQWSNRPEGSSCGDPTDTECTSPDACDGAGLCEDNHKPDDTVCLDEPNVCTFDLCDNGLCAHPPVDQGVPCGDPAVHICDGPDLCDGDSVCDPSYFGAGVACGDGSDTACTDPDICDGAGVCLDKHVPDGVPCDDADECTGGDECANGACVGDGTIPTPDLLALSSRHIRITPQTGTYNLRLFLHVTSPNDWPCLDDYVNDARHLSNYANREFLFPVEWGGFVLTDPDVFPSTEYYVMGECQDTGPLYVSSPGIVNTWLWGDVDNDGDVDGIDVTHVVQAFKNMPGHVPIEAADLYPCIPSGHINALDVTVSEQAFRGLPYYCDPPCHP
jgi:hypothetical protein